MSKSVFFNSSGKYIPFFRLLPMQIPDFNFFLANFHFSLWRMRKAKFTCSYFPFYVFWLLPYALRKTEVTKMRKAKIKYLTFFLRNFFFFHFRNYKLRNLKFGYVFSLNKYLSNFHFPHSGKRKPKMPNPSFSINIYNK